MIDKLNRRSFLGMGVAAGASMVAPPWMKAQAPAPDRVAQMRAGAASAPIKTTKLYDNLYLLQGAGGNMAVQTGPDGKLLIDSSFSTAVPKIREAMNALSSDPAHLLINTHWHIDHTDGNEGMHAAGFSILAHSETRMRLSRPAEMKLLGITLPAAPDGALPTAAFDNWMRLWLHATCWRPCAIAWPHSRRAGRRNRKCWRRSLRRTWTPNGARAHSRRICLWGLCIGRCKKQVVSG